MGESSQPPSRVPDGSAFSLDYGSLALYILRIYRTFREHRVKGKSAIDCWQLVKEDVRTGTRSSRERVSNGVNRQQVHLLTNRTITISPL